MKYEIKKEQVHDTTVDVVKKMLESSDKLNLKDYDATYKNFRWEDYYDEIKWFERGKTLNMAVNAVDKHIGTPVENKIAVIWESKDGNVEKYTYKQLYELSNRFANVLAKLGINKGDRVFLFLPRIPEVHITFIGVLKTGAIAGTLFSAFGYDALKDRLGHCDARVVITTPDLLERVEHIAEDLPALEYMIVVDREGKFEDKEVKGKKELNYSSLMSDVPAEYNPMMMNVDDPAYILYTSGSTGKPKGVVHVHGGALIQHLTGKWVLNFNSDDMYWCTADHGWVTGVVYVILSPLSNGMTTLFYEGRFDSEKWYSLIEKYKVNIFYTAPTAIRMLMKYGDELPKKYDLSSLKHIYSVGEPLNPEPIRWGYEVFGRYFHDTWWQTETGAQMIVNFPCMDIKIGSMGKPFPGIIAGIVDDDGNELPPYQEGNLALKRGWPSMVKEFWNNPKKYESVFKNGWYITGDMAYKDNDGYYWFMGRSDDLIMTAGERVGPFEVESALIDHDAVNEAAVIGKPDPERGQIIKAFVVLNKGYENTPELLDDIKRFVKQHLAGHAYPREIEIVDSLPKTRSGKIMRRVLRAKELGLPIGDLSTMVK